MGFGAIADVVLKLKPRVFLGQLEHEPVAFDLGVKAGGRYDRDQIIGADYSPGIYKFFGQIIKLAVQGYRLLGIDFQIQ